MDSDETLRKFFARNPDLIAGAGEPAPTPRNPMDIGTVPVSVISQAVAMPAFKDLLFPDETIPVLRKRLIWDIIPDEEIARWSTHLGVIAGSEEGNAVEHKSAVDRRNNLLPVLPLLRVMAWTAGDVVSRAKMLDSGSYEEGDTVALGGRYDVTQEVAAGVMAVVANLLDMEVLTYGKAVTQ